MDDLRQSGDIDDGKYQAYVNGVVDLLSDDLPTKPLPPASYPELAKPALAGYTVDQLLEVGWDLDTLDEMHLEGRLDLVD